MDFDVGAQPALRPDYLMTQKQRGDRRSTERLIAHYLLERRLAERLLSSPKTERGKVYSQVYAELFASLPDHPQHTRGSADDARSIQLNVKYLRDLLTQDCAFLEIGCGDAATSFAVAGSVGHAYGLDVTDALIPYDDAPPNFHFLKTRSTNIDLPDNTVDIAFSNQLMEHLHPEDALEQLGEVIRVLRPGGAYWCRTPNRVTGPHDVSRYFDYVATGLHLQEYDYRSIRKLFKQAGFRHVRFDVMARGRKARFPYWMAWAAESFLTHVPGMTNSHIVKRVMELNVVGVK